MLKTSEESERTDDFFAPSPHPESYPSQPSLSMWGGNTWQPHRGTHCHTGAPTGYKARDIHTVEELRINRGTTARQICWGHPHSNIYQIYQHGHHSKANIYQGHHTNMHEIYQKGTTARKIYQRQPHTNVYQTYQQGHHSHTNIYQPATQPHWPLCRASGTTQSKGTPQEKPKK